MRLPALTLTALVLALLLGAAESHADVAVGAAAPDFTLTDLSGKQHTLSSYKGKTVVLEWVNPNCPFVQRHTKEQTMKTTAARHPEAVWLTINSTAAKHSDFMDAKAMTAWARENGVATPILLDKTSTVGKQYGAKTTPHMFVIGKDGKVLYNGAIDDDPSGRKPVAERKNYVDQALTSITKGQPVSDASTKPYGCSVKYES